MENPFYKLMEPLSIATVGAGNNPMKIGSMYAMSILNSGYQGKFYPIHPNEENVLGHKAYSSILDLPEAPDLAVFILPAHLVANLMEDFGKIGTKRAIIITAGFRETGPDGKKREDELNEIAGKYGIRFVGPNCMGVMNSEISLNATIMNISNKPGMLGFISQSGTYVAQVIPYLKKKGIAYSKALSIGNEANIDVVDALEYLGEDKQTKAIAIYIEGIRDGQRFIEVARKITPHKPVLAQYVGGSSAGSKAGLSHTGAMAGPDYLYDGVFQQAGIIRVHSVEELYEYGWALATQPPLKGKRIGIITNSGGPGTAISDTCNKGGLEVPDLSFELQDRIKEIIPSQGASRNPIDITLVMDSSLISTKLPELVFKSGEVDGVFIHGLIGTGIFKEIYPNIKGLLNDLPIESFLENLEIDVSPLIKFQNEYKLPLMISSFFDREDSCTAFFQDNNIPVFNAPEKAARAMLALYKHLQIRNREKIVPPELPALNDEANNIIKTALKRGQRALDEYEAKKILSAYGVPVTGEYLVFSEGDAVDAANSIGFPVAMKGCSPEIMHKTGKGLIHLNINNEDGARGSFNAIRNAAGNDVPVIVQEMVNGNREFVSGMTRFPGFGPCLLFGLGGVFTEALKDSVFRVAPLSIADAREMIFDIRAKELLDEFRGMPAVDTLELADILQKIGFISILHPEISEIDLNPIMINDSRPVVVDALFVLD